MLYYRCDVLLILGLRRHPPDLDMTDATRSISTCTSYKDEFILAGGCNVDSEKN